MTILCFQAPSELVDLDEDASVVNLDTTEEEQSPLTRTSGRQASTSGGIRRRRNATGTAARNRRNRNALGNAQTIVDLCSPMGPPSTPLTNAARRARNRRRPVGSSSDEAETINLDNSLVELNSAGPSAIPPRPAARASSSSAASALDTSSDGPHCPICLCSWTSPVSTMCGHIFCKDCIAQWVRVTKKCPVCKAGPAKLKTHPIFIS